MWPTIDDILAVVRNTAFHPVASLFWPGVVLVCQSWACNFRGPDDVSLAGLAPRLSWPLKTALACVAVAWALQWNRRMNRRALNPAPKADCSWPREVVVVTGGSGGIGSALVRKLELLGATVVILDAVPPAFTTGKDTHYFKADVASLENVTKVYNSIVATLGPPTMLVANAGVLRGTTILDTCEHDLRSTFDVNVFGVLFCIKVFLPSMIAADKGHILFTSVAAYSTAAGVAAYSASKAAVNCLVDGLQTELKHKYGIPRVKVSTVMPAMVNTKMFEDLDLPMNNFIMPLLEPARVAERMVEVLANGQSSETIMMPAMSNASPVLHALPHWVRVLAQDAGAGATSRLSATEKRMLQRPAQRGLQCRA